MPPLCISVLNMNCVEGDVTLPALTRFHFARLFWNQILTWTSVSWSCVAIQERSARDRYFLVWNSPSSLDSCSLVNAVRRRRPFPFQVGSSGDVERCNWLYTKSWESCCATSLFVPRFKTGRVGECLCLAVPCENLTSPCVGRSSSVKSCSPKKSLKVKWINLVANF